MNEEWDEALEGGKEIDIELTGTTRWGTLYRRIFEEDGKTFAVDYELTEQEGLVDDGPPEIYEVVAKEITVTKWVKKVPEWTETCAELGLV